MFTHDHELTTILQQHSIRRAHLVHSNLKVQLRAISAMPERPYSSSPFHLFQLEKRIEAPISRFSGWLKISPMISVLFLMSSTALNKNMPTNPPISSSSRDSSRQPATLPLTNLVKSPLSLKLFEYFHLTSSLTYLIIFSSYIW